MSRKRVAARIICIVVFFLFIGTVLDGMSKIICAKFIGDSTTIVDGFYAEKKNIELRGIKTRLSMCSACAVSLCYITDLRRTRDKS